MGSCFSSSKSKPLSSSASSGKDTTTSSGGYNPKNALAQSGNGQDSSLVLHDSSSVVLGGEMDTLRNNYKPSDSPAQRDHKSKQPMVVLVPHQHTLFCERKQRVCTAVGKYQELEILKVTGIDNVKNRWVWCRGKTNKTSDKHNVHIVTHSEAQYQYTLSKEDVGHFLWVGYTDSLDKALDMDQLKFTNAVGPILPGPPRILDFCIEGDVKVGGKARIEGQYIGGMEGQSEYWWIRITKDGKRIQITEPKAITTHPDSNQLSVDDPRLHVITTEDIGCTFKAKCRPIRDDGAAGEIFTSKSSKPVQA